MVRIILITALLILLVSIPAAQAEWSEPVRITYELGLLHPRAVMVGDTIHVVCDLDTDIYYLRSNDNGETWTDPVIPVPDDSIDGSNGPDIAYSDGCLHIVFNGYITGGEKRMYHISSTDGGRTCSEPHLITETGWKYLRIIADYDTLYVSYIETSRIFFARSFDRGVTWENPIYVERDSLISFDQCPSLNYSQGVLHLFYPMSIVNNPVAIEIYHKRSTDKGVTWSERQMLSDDDQRESQLPSAATDSNGNFFVTWFDYKYGHTCIGVEGDILGRVGHNQGDILLPETRLTYTQTGVASHSIILNGRIHAVWNDWNYYYCEKQKIMYATSSDWGETWSEPAVISGPSRRTELHPFMLYDINGNDTIFHCLMAAENPDGIGKDIYYFNGRPDITGIEYGDEEFINDYSLIESYPNPFNSNVTLIINNPEGGETYIVIFNIYGQEIRKFKTQGGEQTRMGWDAADAAGNKVSSGIYFARARTSRRNQTIKLVYLR